MGKNQHVVRTENGWGVRGAGNTRLTSEHRKQSTAAQVATSIAKHQKSEVIIHNRKNQFRERNSYGNDPHPPKG
jgi:hypothetical protein